MVLRSVLFNIAFYLNLTMWSVGFLPLLVLPRKRLIWVAHGWALSSNWLLRVIGGIRVEFRGGRFGETGTRCEGPLLIAAKHQSFFETYALLACFVDPTFIQKRELSRIPVFGWWTTRLGMISVDRRRGARALKDMVADAHTEVAHGRQILIFPEGTRRPPGADPDYQPGIALLYQKMNVPCMPVALNSGLYWPRRKWQRFPGTIVVEFLDPIPAGLPRREFMTRLEHEIETASDRLLVEAANSANPPPLPESAQRRLREISSSVAKAG